MTISPRPNQPPSSRLIWLACSLVLATAAFSLPAFAHHPWEGQQESFNWIQGLLSGIAHPILGADHLLFLLSIGLAGFASARLWLPLLLGSGFLGCLLGLMLPAMPGAELVMGLSLVASGFVAIGLLNAGLMLPLIGLHGYVLAAAMVGAEPTPVITYLLGLVISEALVITAGMFVLRRCCQQKRLLAGALMGIGLTMTYGTLVG